MYHQAGWCKTLQGSSKMKRRQPAARQVMLKNQAQHMGWLFLGDLVRLLRARKQGRLSTGCASL